GRPGEFPVIAFRGLVEVDAEKGMQRGGGRIFTPERNRASIPFRGKFLSRFGARYFGKEQAALGSSVGAELEDDSGVTSFLDRRRSWLSSKDVPGRQDGKCQLQNDSLQVEGLRGATEPRVRKHP